METKKLITFLDAIGRTIIAEPAGESETHLKVKNPAVVNIVPTPDPQGRQSMSLQLFPLFFKEFLADKEQAIIFKYNKNNIVMTDGDVIFEVRLNMQYQQLFVPAPAAPVQPVAPAGSVEPIKLFD